MNVYSIDHVFDSEKALVRKYGRRQADLIMLRIRQLMAVPNLAALSTLPGVRCHPLKAERKGLFAVDIAQPYRLILEPGGEPVPKMEDGSVDIARVTEVMIIEVTDYHG